MSSGLSSGVIYKRIKNGMNADEAQTLPLCWNRKLTIQKVLEIKKHGLTIGRSAFVLNTSPSNLINFLRRHNIDWPSKGIYCKSGQKNPDSVKAKCESAGVSADAVWAQMRRKKLSVQDAIECVSKNKNRQKTAGKVLFADYELKKRRLTTQEIIECEKLGLTYIESAKHLKVPYMTLVSRINKMGLEWRGKGNKFGDEK